MKLSEKKQFAQRPFLSSAIMTKILKKAKVDLHLKDLPKYVSNIGKTQKNDTNLELTKIPNMQN